MSVKAHQQIEWLPELHAKADYFARVIMGLVGVGATFLSRVYDFIVGLAVMFYALWQSNFGGFWAFCISLALNIITTGAQHNGITAKARGNARARWLLTFLPAWIIDTVIDAAFVLAMMPQEGFKIYNIVPIHFNGHFFTPSMWVWGGTPLFWALFALHTWICFYGDWAAFDQAEMGTGVHREKENPPEAPVSRSGADKQSPQKSRRPEAAQANPLTKQFLQWLASLVAGKAYDKASKKKQQSKQPDRDENEVQLPKPDFYPVLGYAYNSQNGRHRQPLPFGKVVAGHVLEVMLSETEWGFMLVYDKDSEYMYGVRCDEQGKPVPGVSEENASLKLKFKKDKLYKRVWA